MPRDVLIRPTTTADLAAITAIYAEAVAAGTGSFELRPPDAAEMTRRWQNRVTKGYPHIVATSEGAILGYAYISRHRTSRAYHFLVEDSIFVASAAQGCRVGQALLSELIKLCEGLEFRQMIALIADENAPSVKLHERFGFCRIGLIEGSAFKQGRWIDTLLMQRALGQGNTTPPHNS